MRAIKEKVAAVLLSVGHSLPALRATKGAAWQTDNITIAHINARSYLVDSITRPVLCADQSSVSLQKDQLWSVECGADFTLLKTTAGRPAVTVQLPGGWHLGLPGGWTAGT